MIRKKIPAVCLLAIAFAILTLNSSPGHAQPPKKGPKVPEAVETDITADVQKTVNGLYYKLSGPFGQTYLLANADVAFKSASLTTNEEVTTTVGKKEVKGYTNVRRLVFKVTDNDGGFTFKGMAGAQLEYLDADAKKGAKPEIKVIRTGDETHLFNKGDLTIVLGKPVPPLTEAEKEAMKPKAKGKKN